MRKRLNYPPFCDIILLKFTGKNEDEIKKYSKIVFNNLKRNIMENEAKIYNPVPSPIDKIKSNFRWRIIIKGKITSSLLDKIQKSMCLDNKNITLVVDINPNNMM